MGKVVLLASGGLDSTTVAYWLHERAICFIPIFYDYGQHCAETEWRTLNTIFTAAGFDAPQRINLSDVFAGSTSRMINEPDLWTDSVSDEDLYIPYRTLLFLSTAASIAQSRGFSEVYSGYINSNHAKELDCSATFLNGLDELAESVGVVRFAMPFRNWSKAEVAAEAVRLGVPIGRTYSCQMLSDTPCGACPNCVERLNALQEIA